MSVGMPRYRDGTARLRSSSAIAPCSGESVSYCFCRPIALLPSKKRAESRCRAGFRAVGADDLELGQAGGCRRRPSERRSDDRSTQGAAPSEARERAAADGAGHHRASHGLVLRGEWIDFQRGYVFMRASRAELKVRIEGTWLESDGIYGSPRIHAALQADGKRVSRKRVARLIEELGIEGGTRRRFRTGTTKQDAQAEPAPGRVNRDFSADGPDRLWMADSRTCRPGPGWLVALAVIDGRMEVHIADDRGYIRCSDPQAHEIDAATRRQIPAPARRRAHHDELQIRHGPLLE